VLIYSTVLYLQADFDEIVQVVGECLSYGVKDMVENLGLFESNNVYTRDSRRIQSARWVADGTRMQSLQYTHPDTDVSGRLWITEIGIRQERATDPTIKASIVLRTSDISTRVDSPVLTTRPRVVNELLNRCNPASSTPGLSVIELHEDNAQKFLDKLVQSPVRRHPILVISPTVDGRYPVDPGEMLFYLGGLADVAKIQPEADSYAVQQILGSRYAAWHGAVNLIHPPLQTDGSNIRSSNQLFLLDDIQMMHAAVDFTAESELLGYVTHRVNLPNSWQHLSIQEVNDRKKQAELKQRREEAAQAGEMSEYIDLLEETNEQLEHEKRGLVAEIETLQNDVNFKDYEIDELKREQHEQKRVIAGLQSSLHHGKAKSNGGRLDDDIRERFVRAFNGEAILEEALKLIEFLYPDRVIVLESALNSARDSAVFEDRARAFQLLLTLVTEYYVGLVEGNGDATARTIFGSSYSARESETVESNRRARRLRTFHYKGEGIEMMRHLKIGVADNKINTLRIHFHWDSDDQKIVIGHCGKHLDHR